MGATTNVMVEILFIYWLYDRVGDRFSVGFLATRELVGAVDGKPIELSQSARLSPWKGRQRSKHSRKFRT
jgi:hypothetical protein